MIRDLGLEVKTLPRHLRLTFQTLANHVNRRRLAAGEPAFVWPSVESLADETGLSVRTVYRQLAELLGLGAIRKAVRTVLGYVRKGWDLVAAKLRGAKCDDVPDRGSSEDEIDLGSRSDATPVAEIADTGVTNHPLQHNRTNSTPRASARVGGGLGIDSDPNPHAAQRTTRNPERQKTPGAVRRPGHPRTPDEARAEALWRGYETRRVHVLGDSHKRHRVDPRHRDLTRIVELVDHVSRTRTDGDRDVAWEEVERYANEAIDIADRTTEPGTAARDRLEGWRCDGWEWSPDRFDRVIRDVASDVHGKASDAWWEARRIEEEKYRAEYDAAPKMSAEALSDFVAEQLGERAPHGQASSSPA